MLLTALYFGDAVAAGRDAGRVDPTTVSVDTLRTGWDKSEPGLSPPAVAAADFGQLFATSVNGQVYAQPVVVGGIVIAVTENNWIYGVDDTTGVVRWSRNVGPPWPASIIGCRDLAPNIGITSTPVYDPQTNAVFFVAKVNDGRDGSHPRFAMHSVDPATGVERTGWPVTIQGAPTNDPANPFDPKTAAQRPGLLLLDGVVYVGFASHCDYGRYVGYVAGVKTKTPTMSTLWSTQADRSNGGGGLWQSGGGMVSDGPGRIFLATGNGLSPAPGPGSAPPGTLAESVVRLQVNADGSLTATDFFSPANNGKLDQDDVDLGSGGPMALPAGFGTAAHPRLLVQIGKDGRVYLLDRDNLGGMAQAPRGSDASVGPPLGPYGGVWGHPAFWGGDGGYVYTVANGGYLRALKYGVDSTGLPALRSAGTSASTFGFTSGSPVVTSDGTRSGTATIWVIHSPGSSGGGAELRAYDALPALGQLRMRFSAPIGTAAKFAVPATTGGRVFVGTRDGKILGFGRPTAAALRSSPTDFGDVAAGTTKHAHVTVTAARPVTISTISTSAPFGTPSISSQLLRLNTGQKMSVPVTFAPTAAGEATGTLSFTTDTGTATIGLRGRGTRSGLGATLPTLPFATVPTGAERTLNVSIVNTGISGVTITGWTEPAAPYHATGLPPVGSTIPAGASVPVSVTYRPSALGQHSGSLSVASTAGSITVPMSGAAELGRSHLTIAPSPVAFGLVPVGSTATQTVDISNTGTVPVTLTGTAAPDGAFNATWLVPEGQQLAPGDTIRQPLTFTPTQPGAHSAVYSIAADNGQGAVVVRLTGTGATTTAGTAAKLVSHPDVLSFAATPLYGYSDTQTLTLWNRGGTPATLSSLSATGDFTATSTCATTIAPSANCVMTVTFHPTARGSRTGTLTIATDRTASPLTIPLSGIGR